RAGEHLGCGVLPGELRVLVKVAVVEVAQNGPELFAGAADVHNEAVRVELRTSKGHVHHVGGAMKILSGAKRVAPEAMGDHEVIPDVERVHNRLLLFMILDS